MMTNEKLSEREEIESLLPWFAAGTLSRRDAERVERALKADAELSRQFEMVREELGETIRVNESLGAPSTRALKSLFEKIDAEAPVARQSAVSLGFMNRVSEFIASFSPRTLAYAGTAAALAIVLQAAVITGNFVGQPDVGNFRTVAIERGAPVEQGAFAQIRFNPQATAADISAFLEAHKASIVAGPAAGTGMYRVKVAVTGLPKEQLAEIVKRLQQDKVVGLATPAE
jgi:anti-sigma factor RsiW